jgi:hypothetical protein
MEQSTAFPASETPRRLGRSTGAVIAGFVTVLVTHTGTDAILHAAAVFPSDGPMSNQLFGLALAYRVVFTVLGGYVTARLAPYKPLRHAYVLGALGLLGAGAGLVATLVSAPRLGPIWYPLALLVLTLPACLLGARLFGNR